MNPSAVMLCHYDPRLVVFPVLAVFAARELLGRINEARGRLWLAWLAGALSPPPTKGQLGPSAPGRRGERIAHISNLPGGHLAFVVNRRAGMCADRHWFDGVNTLRILLADDHELVRAGIRSLLEETPGVEVVGEASNGREALELVRSESPNLVLMDIAMPVLGGLETLARITKNFPNTKVVMLSAFGTEEYVSRAFRSGASGYMLKFAATLELEMVIRSIAQDKMYLSPSISHIIINSHMLARVDGELSPLEQLTARQREILQMIAEGRKTKEIAGTLDISVKTVETHRLQLMARLNIHNVPGLVRYAIRNGIVEV
jgi:DNA-binding NarL/FixJ family response regulator